MKTPRYSDAQIMGILKQAEGGVPVSERWSRDFGPVVKVDRLVKEMTQNDETKEPFA